MRPYHFTRAPRRLRRSGVRLDNVALVPASLLPHKPVWQQLTSELPTGSVLIVTPLAARPKRATLDKVTEHLESCGHRVRTFPASHFLRLGWAATATVNS